MSVSVEHKVAMHRLATERRSQGKPIWAETVTGFRDALDAYDHQNPDDNMIRAIRDELVTLLKASAWYRNAGQFSDLHDTVDELADVANIEVFSPTEDPGYEPIRHFNSVLATVYDMADYDRVWLA